MKPYQNLNENSSVQSFQIYGDGIKIKFSDGSVLLYLYDKIGREVVEELKTLAIQGKGLSTYLEHSGIVGDKIDS